METGNIVEADENSQIEALKRLREPFKKNQISKLPKGTKAQNQCPPEQKVTCKVCGGWHHPNVIHLDYVGHAALTDRLLDVDPFWNWDPLNFDANGLPQIDKNGGMWIKLTVAGMTRLGYGSAPGKVGPDAVKELIGDALRNAAMRFGAALNLWHKGELHVEDEQPISIIEVKQTDIDAGIVEKFNLCESTKEAEELWFELKNNQDIDERIYAKVYASNYKRLR